MCIAELSIGERWPLVMCLKMRLRHNWQCHATLSISIAAINSKNRTRQLVIVCRLYQLSIMSLNGLDVVNAVKARVELAEKAKTRSLEVLNSAQHAYDCAKQNLDVVNREEARKAKAKARSLEALSTAQRACDCVEQTLVAVKREDAGEAAIALLHKALNAVRKACDCAKETLVDGKRERADEAAVHKASEAAQRVYDCAEHALDAAKRENEEASHDLKEAKAALEDVNSKVPVFDLVTPTKERTETASQVNGGEEDIMSKVGDNISIFDVYSIIVIYCDLSSVNGMYQRDGTKNGAPFFRNQDNFELWKRDCAFDGCDGQDGWWIISNDIGLEVEWCRSRPDGGDADPLNDEWMQSQCKVIVNALL